MLSVQVSFVSSVSRLLVLKGRGKESVQELSLLMNRHCLNCHQYFCRLFPVRDSGIHQGFFESLFCSFNVYVVV